MKQTKRLTRVWTTVLIPQKCRHFDPKICRIYGSRILGVNPTQGFDSLAVKNACAATIPNRTKIPQWDRLLSAANSTFVSRPPKMDLRLAFLPLNPNCRFVSDFRQPTLWLILVTFRSLLFKTSVSRIVMLFRQFY